MKATTIGIMFTMGAVMVAGCRNTAIVYDDVALSVSGARAVGSYKLDSVCVDTPYSLRSWINLFGVRLPKTDEYDEASSSSDKSVKPSPANERLTKWLIAKSPDNGVFAKDASVDGKTRTPVKIVVQGKKKNNEGWGTGLNNFLSICTLQIWPTYGSELCTYTVEAEVAGKKRIKTFSIEERRLVSWLPTGLIPVPALADSRGDVRNIDKAETEKVHEAVLSLFSTP